ncbi:MAG: hypothetical protein JNM17_08950 [Archangium sp.]|nr:hypothetical protein [Archangium sp.]
MRSRLLIVLLAFAVVRLLTGLKQWRDSSSESSTELSLNLPSVQPAWPVVRGKVGSEEALWYVAFKHREGVQLCPLEPSDYGWCRELDALPMSELMQLDAGAWSSVSIFQLEERLDELVPPDAVALSSFVTRATKGSRLDPTTREFDRKVDSIAWSFQDKQGGFDDAQVRAWAAKNAKDDALYEAFTKHHAIGSCSMDAIPHITNVLFAELALARGDMPTFIDVQLRLLSGRYDRVAWSSFSDDSQSTRAERLVEAKVDVDALLLGLVVQHPGSKNATEGRIARAMWEVGRAEALLPRVEALATSRSLDAYDRYRATYVWLLLQLPDEESVKTRGAAVRARGEQLDLDALSRQLVARVTTSR